MTRVRLLRKADGSFTCCAEGHSGFAARGNDIVCAAITILLRTVMQTLAETPGLIVTPLDAREGVLSFNAAASRLPNAELSARLKTAGDFLKTGVQSLAREYPGHVEFTDHLEV